MTQGDALGYYAVLEIPLDAGGEIIKQQYRELAKKWHPDINTGADAEAKFQKISTAYTVLKDDASRLKYDILSQAYDDKHFPDMNNLKVYTNRNGDQEVDLRHVCLTAVIGKFFSYTEKKYQEICNYKEAKKVAFIMSLKNWLFGWWGISAIMHNIKAIAQNSYSLLSDTSGNFTLLAHNMLAYAQEKKYDEAYASGRLALRYATPSQKLLIEQFMSKLPYQREYVYRRWPLWPLKAVQAIPPFCLIVAMLLKCGTDLISAEDFRRMWTADNSINYFQEVRFNNGAKTVDDVAVAKVVSIPVNVDDMSKLYHVKHEQKVMYGPDDNFDELKVLPSLTTVRVTGYTPDKKWVRIMIDNGEMGFVPAHSLKQGVGKEIPDSSQIYQSN